MKKKEKYTYIYAVEDSKYGYLYFAKTLKTIKKLYEERGTDNGLNGIIEKVKVYE